MSSSDSQNDTWSDYFGEKISNGLNLALDTVSATVEYGRERIKTPENLIPENIIPENFTEMCFEGAEEAFSGVNSRLEQSKRAANPRMRAEMSHVVAGRAGEEFVLKELEKLGSVRQAVRIPNMDGKRSEIDLVLQTRSHIYLFEVKNWSGSVELTPDGKWKQIRNKNANPPEIIHENVLDKVRRKEIAFREKLGLNKSNVSSFVVFPKKNLTLTYAIGREPQVLSSVEFDNWLKSSTPTNIRTVAELILPKSWTGFDEKVTNQIDENLGTAGTWDTVVLEGGRILTGDFRSGPSGLNGFDRKRIGSANFTHTRNALIGGVKAFFGQNAKATINLYERNPDFISQILSRSCSEFELPIDSVIIFREAGKREDSRIEVNDIVQITFSQK